MYHASFLPAYFPIGKFFVFVLVPQEKNFGLMLVMPKYTILEIANDLKIVIFPSSDNCFMRQSFITEMFFTVTNFLIF